MLILSSDVTREEKHGSAATPRFESLSRMARIQQRGILRVGVVSDMPGFTERAPDTGGLRGLDIEVSKVVAQAIFGGSRRSAAKCIDYAEIHLGERELVLKEREVDLVIAAFAITSGRRKSIGFSVPYFGTSLGVLVGSDYPVDDLSRLETARVGVPIGTVGAEFVMQNDLGRHVVEYECVREMVSAVRSGEIHACVTTAPVLEHFADSDPERLKKPTWSLRHLPHGIGFNKNDDDLRHFVDARLDNLWDDGILLRSMSQIKSRRPLRTRSDTV